MLSSAEPVPAQAGNAGRFDQAARWLVVVALAGLVVHAWTLKSGVDFQVFWVAARRVLAGEALYRASDGVFPFKYAPPVALLLSPLGLLPQRAAYAVWLVASGACLWGLARWSQRTLGGTDDGLRTLLLLVLVTPFLLHLLALGQSDAILLFLAVESEVLRRRAPVVSGLLLALATLAKPPMLLFALLALWRREWRRLSALVAGLLGSMVLTALVLGPGRAAAEVGAWRSLLAQTTPEMLCAVQNQSLAGMVCTYLGASPGQPAFQLELVGLALLLVGAAAWAVHRVWGMDATLADRLALALTFYGTALLSPLGWRTNLLALVPLLALLLIPLRTPDRAARVARGAALGVLAATILVANYEVLGNERFRRLLGLRDYGLVALWVAVCTVFLTLRRARAEAAPRGLGTAPG